jgi:hypothetical protein
MKLITQKLSNKQHSQKNQEKWRNETNQMSNCQKDNNNYSSETHHTSPIKLLGRHVTKLFYGINHACDNKKTCTNNKCNKKRQCDHSILSRLRYESIVHTANTVCKFISIFASKCVYNHLIGVS